MSQCSFKHPEDISYVVKLSGHVTLATPFQGRLVVRKVKLDIASSHIKFDGSSFSRSKDI